MGHFLRQLIGRHRRPSSHPAETSWKDFNCLAVDCMWNNAHGNCKSPSKARIGADSRCQAFATAPPIIHVGD